MPLSLRYHLGACHYLSPRGGGEDLRGGSLKTLGEYRGETTQICLENEDMGGGDRGSHQKLLGGITSGK